VERFNWKWSLLLPEFRFRNEIPFIRNDRWPDRILKYFGKVAIIPGNSTAWKPNMISDEVYGKGWLSFKRGCTFERQKTKPQLTEWPGWTLKTPAGNLFEGLKLFILGVAYPIVHTYSFSKLIYRRCGVTIICSLRILFQQS